MNLLHRKCLVASSAAHGLLLLILFIGSAFVEPKPDPIDLPLLDVIPDKVVDSLLYGGGEPEVQPFPPPQARTPAPAPIKTQEPEQKKKEPEPEKAPAPVIPVKQPEPKVELKKPSKPKPVIKVAKETIKINQPARSTQKSSVQPELSRELESRISDTADRLSRKLTKETSIKVPGPGGEAYANYGQVVISIYRSAWIQPPGIDKASTVKATVTNARDGRVLSSRITRLSGNRTVDDSVEQVLRRVKNVRPFPVGAKDETRTFDLSFELTPAELSG
jgi:outer membrane biosynthesis protein TonB